MIVQIRVRDLNWLSLSRRYRLPEPDATFDAMRLQGTALDVNLAVRRLRRGEALRPRDQIAFVDASSFIERALRGQQMRLSRRLSATPSWDLLALRYVQAARPRPLQDDSKVEHTLRELVAVLTSLAHTTAIPERSTWGLDQIDDFFAQIFSLATAMAGRPTDLTRPRGARESRLAEVLSR